MPESSILIDDSPGQEVGAFESMRLAQRTELENTSIHRSYSKEILTYSMIEVLHGLIKKLLALCNCTAHVLQFLRFLPRLKDRGVRIFVLLLEKGIAAFSNVSCWCPHHMLAFRKASQFLLRILREIF